MNYDLEWRIKRMLEIGGEILKAGRGGGRVYAVTPVLKIQNPRKQYYSDAWRWQEGMSCQAGKRNGRATRALEEKTVTSCKNLL